MATVAAAAAALVPGASFAAPSARISASRASGPAPLAVYFDATATTDSSTSVDTFRQLGYRFTFGDAGAGTWQHSGRPKNEQIGAPLAAHVFERAGTYTVQVEAKDANGASSIASVTITVESPEAAFPGARTVCLSRTADFTGCPSGARQVANASSWPAFEDSTRYLLHRGQDFTALNSLNFSRGGVGLADAQVGAFGSGAKPVVGNISIDSGLTGDSSWHRRIVIADLDSGQITQDTAGFDLLVFRNTLSRGGGIDIASAFGFMLEHQASATSWRNPENIFVVENSIDMNFSRNTIIGLAGNATRFAIMGNLIDRTWEHNVRIWQAHKAFVAHNSLTGRCGEQIRGALKFHASGMDPVATTMTPRGSYHQRSSQVAIADNLIGSANSNINWLAGSSPQNIDEPEAVEMTIWEDNQFRHGANYARDITWHGRNMTERGNRNVTENRAASYGVPAVSALLASWNGPYYGSQTSMKLRFSSGASIRPMSPSALVVE